MRNKVIGRPKKKETEKLIKFVNIRFSVNELEKVEQKSRSLNMSRSEYLRATALENLDNSPAFRAIPNSIRIEFALIRKQINFLRFWQINAGMPQSETNSIISDLHKIVSLTGKIVSDEIENHHISPLENLLSDVRKMIEKDSFSIVKYLEIQRKIEKILLDKKLYFKI